MMEFFLGCCQFGISLLLFFLFVITMIYIFTLVSISLSKISDKKDDYNEYFAKLKLKFKEDLLNG